MVSYSTAYGARNTPAALGHLSLKRNICRFAIGLLLFLPRVVPIDASQSLVINEVMSSNAAAIYDRDGNTPDWVEIYSQGSETVALSGYGLSDDAALPLKWTFPDVSLTPGNYLLVFASGKDIRTKPLHWTTIVDQGDLWSYHVPGEELPVDWKTIGFDDSGWLSGPSGFGYGDGDDATSISSVISVFIRKRFAVSDPSGVLKAVLHIDYDDAFVAFLNGVEIARGNIGQPGDATPYSQPADNYNHEASIYRGGKPERFDIDDPSAVLVGGDNVLSIQIHNHSTGSSDLTAIPFLTLGMSDPPEPVGAPPAILDLVAQRLHTNFKISSQGETLLLSDAAEQLCDIVAPGVIETDISYGRQPDGGQTWLYFAESTPGRGNTTQGYVSSVLNAPAFSHEGGLYENGFLLTLSGENGSDSLYYTRDGSIPSLASSKYTEGIIVHTSVVIRARVLQNDALPGRIATHTYLVGRSVTLPVVAVTTAPGNLWDEDTGIYATGDGASSEYPYHGANFWQDWEKPAHIEFYEVDGTNRFRIDAGIKIFGGWSRAQPQKSLTIFARGEYGTSDIAYRFFQDKPIEEFEAIVLRNSGNDWGASMFRDGMMTTLLKDLDIERQGFRPSTVYLNGEYWGILNIREKINEHFLASNKGADPDRIDMLEFNGSVIHGDAIHYRAMRDYISANDMSQGEHYDYIRTQMDVANFILYNISMIYFDNRDWPMNNNKYWRPKTDTGRWRWIVYDTDFGFGRYSASNYAFNTLDFALEPNGPTWPNPPWSTFLLRKLLESSQFRRDFINCFADQLNTAFKEDRVVDTIDTYAQMLSVEMPLHFDRWGGSLSQWASHVAVMKQFAANRPAHILAHLQSRFNLSDTHVVSLDAAGTGEGIVRINTVDIQRFPWEGRYFGDNPIRVTAIPKTGARFAGWIGTDAMTTQTLALDLAGDIALQAEFELVEDYTSPIVINEINYHSADNYDMGDWVELYNNSGIALDISGWILRDSDATHGYAIPSHTRIPATSYLVLCRDRAAFFGLHPEADGIYGDLDFGLSADGDAVRLYDRDGNLVDSVAFDDTHPWPEAADGSGSTLELIHPDLDNALPESWSARNTLGTPGAANVGLTDLLHVLQLLSGIDLQQPISAGVDVDADTKVGLAEAIYVMQKVAGLR